MRFRFPLLLLAALLPLQALAAPPPQPQQGQAAGQERQKPEDRRVVAPASALQIVRRLLGIPQRIAVGGSRSTSALTLCLISPALSSSPPGPQPAAALAISPLPSPTLLVAEPLAELRLETPQGRILWRRLASSTAPISGPIPWPLPPLQAGDSLLLRLRPLGAPGADFAAVTLQPAAAADLERHGQLLAQLRRQSDPGAWNQAIEQAAGPNPALAIALLTSPQAPPSLQAVAASLRCPPPARP